MEGNLSILRILILGVFIFSLGCGHSNNSESEDVNNNNTPAIDEDLAEWGDNPSEEEETAVDPTIVSKACTVFNIEENNLGEQLKSMYKNWYRNCENLDENKEEALFIASSFGGNLYREFIENQNADLCVKLARRAIRKLMTSYRRAQKIGADHPKKDLLTLRNTLTKERLNRIIKRLVHKGCVDPVLDRIEYTHGDIDKVLQIDSNHIVNGSFELFKNIYDDQKGTSYLEDGWTIVDSNNVPGWRIKEVNDESDSKKCSFLEVQTAGVVTNAPDGNQLVELDSHCTTSTGRRVSGDANIEIFQRFPVVENGVYRLKLKAQKRSGRYGNLEIALYQKKRDKEYTAHALVDRAEWVDVCQEIDVVDNKKNITVAIRDAGGDDRQTYGVLVDDIQFEKGRCDINL